MFRALLVVSLGLVVGAVGTLGLGKSEARPAPARTVTPAQQLSQLLGFIDAKLVRVDPETLRPVPGREIAVGSGGCAPRQGGSACWSNPPWTVSPDGMRLALARNDLSSVQLVNPSRMRLIANLKLGVRQIGALAWLARGRLLALEELAGERQQPIAFDLARRRVAARRPLRGSVLSLGRTSQELVMLLGPARAIGSARVAVADTRGVVRFVDLPRILAGSKLLGTGSNHPVDSRLPGLAVDPQRRRAFVVSNSLIAELNLRTFSVSYHEVERRSSFLTRLWNWLEPAAHAKQVSGYVRASRWLGGDLLAVSGWDTAGTQPAGLLVIDARSWNARTINRGTTSFDVAESLLLATGGSWDPSKERSTGIGVAAYSFDGEKRFQLFEGERAWFAGIYGGHAYVGLSGQESLQIVELATGRVVGVRHAPLPWLLLGPASGWWWG